MRDLPWSLHTTSAPLGHKGVSDAKQIRDAGGIKLLHICPATNNLPTRMTRAAWATLCAATQRKARERECIDKNQQYLMRMAKRLNVCALCQGKTLPRGLEFIEAAEMAELIKPKEEAMAKQSKLGVCENCGEKGMLTGSYGQRVCTTCLKIRSSVNNHVDKIATAARALGKGEELLAALVPDGGGLAIQVTADLLQDIAGLVGYPGADPAELVEAVRRATDKGSTVDCAECGAANDLLEIADLVGKRGASSGLVVEAVRGLLNEPWPPSGSDQHRVDLLRACGLELDDAVSASSRKDWSWAAAAAVQTIGELERDQYQLREQVDVLQGATRWESEDTTRLRDELTRAGAEVERLRDRAQESESRLIWYREALQVLRDRLGLDHLGEDEDVVERMLEAIASQAQALTRFQELARAAAVRADHLEGELELQIGVNEAQAAVEAVAAQKLWEPEPAPTVPTSTWGDESLLADFGRRVLRGGQSGQAALLDIALAALRGDALRGEAVAGLIEAARRAAA